MVSEVINIERLGKAPGNIKEFYRVEYVFSRWRPNVPTYRYVIATDELGAYAEFMKQERQEHPVVFETIRNQKEQSDV
jgi:hypothetical protein